MCSNSFQRDVWRNYRHLNLRFRNEKNILGSGDLASRVYSRTVSRAVQSVAPEAVRSILLSRDFLLDSEASGLFFSRIASRASQSLTHIDLGKNCTNRIDHSQAVVEILRALPRLTHVAIHAFRPGWESFASLPSLKSLTISSEGTVPIVQLQKRFSYAEKGFSDSTKWTMTQISHLRIEAHSKLIADIPESFIRSCPNLTSLEVSSLYEPSSARRITAFVSFFQNLSAFKATYPIATIHLQPRGFLPLSLTTLPNISFLSVRFCHFCNDSLLRALAVPHLPNLRSIEMVSYGQREGITDAGFTTFCLAAGEHLKQLRTLILPSCGALTDESIQHLPLIRGLAVLDTTDWMVSPRVLNILASSPHLCNTLESWNLSRCTLFNLTDVAAIVRSFHRLVELDLSYADVTRSDYDKVKLSELQNRNLHILLKFQKQGGRPPLIID